MLRPNAFNVVDKIKPEHVLVSVFDKTGLDVLIPGLLRASPDVMIYSTGGTGKKIMEILGANAGKNYMAVEEFTGAPEMEGGLVKTLHPKIHSGLLAERGNPAHIEYLEKTMAQFGKGPGFFFDVFVGNFYPFSKTVAKEDATAETARINIDIGGPGMTMAAAKNWHSVSVLTDPEQYKHFLEDLEHFGSVSAKLRFDLARFAFTAIGNYRMEIGEYFMGMNFEEDALPTINLV